jgi:hypothetical protein
MWSRGSIVISLIATFVILLGCSTSRLDRLDENWGRSLEEAKTNQILNLEAQKNLDPVVGLDSQSAEKVMKAYRESFGQKRERKADISIKAQSQETATIKGSK